MGGSRRRLKRGKAKVRVGLPKKQNIKPPTVLLPHSGESLDWQSEKTLEENYTLLGVSSNPNFKSGRNNVNSTDLHVADDQLEENDDLREALGQKKLLAPSKPQPRLTKMQRVHMKRLIDKYGTDFEAMFRDAKLNKMQHSVGVLKQLHKRFVTYENQSFDRD